MKLNIKILLLLIVTSSIYSCNKIDDVLPNIHPGTKEFLRALSIHTNLYDNFVGIYAFYTVNPFYRDSSYSIKAFARVTKNGLPVNVGPLNIGDVTINAGSDNMYDYTYPLDQGKALFGSRINAQISYSPNVQTLTHAMIVVPAEIYPSYMALPNSLINRSADLPLSWAPDPNNQFHQVQIQFTYNKGISQYYVPGMPDAIEDLVYNVPDNGSFAVPKADLARYPKDAYVGFSITRVWMDDSNSRIVYLAITEAHTGPLLVVGQ